MKESEFSTGTRPRDGDRENLLRRFLRRVRTFGKSEAGPTSVEYAILLVLLLSVYLTTIQTLGRNNWTVFNRAARNLGTRSTGT